MADDAGDVARGRVAPVAKALAWEQVAPAQCAERHCLAIVGEAADGDRVFDVRRDGAYWPVNASLPGVSPPDGAGCPVPVERDESLIELCHQAIARLARRLPEAQLYCHMRVGDALRVVAAAGGLRLIYEVKQSQGGICWRAVETGEAQLVDDVRRDPDYMATDERVRSEVAVPVAREGEIVLVLDAEFSGRAFTAEEAEAVEAEAAALGRELVG